MQIRTYHEVQEHESNLPDQMAEQQVRVDARLASVGNVIGVMSGKGGVGKSLVSALLAAGLSKHGLRVGVIDADLNGPSMPRFLGLESCPLEETDDGTLPAVTKGGLRVISMSLLIEEDKALTWREPIDAGFVWRGAQERRALREFISDVAWGELDVLFVDLPPGTGRLAELHGLVPGMLGTITVTIPSVASQDAVARSLHFSEQRGLHVLGLVENLSGLYEGQAGSELAREFSIPLLGQIPFSPELAVAADDGSVEDWLDTEESLQAEIHGLVGAVADICKKSETKLAMHEGTVGEQQVQATQGSRERAKRFYDRQMREDLSSVMVKLIAEQEMVFVATADADGNCDCSPRFGTPGFVITLDEKTLAYPEYRGNGVFASLGNIIENPHIGLVFVDFFRTTVGLHVNGTAALHPTDKLPIALSTYIEEEGHKVDSKVEQWVVITVDEAYIHCAKHVPRMTKKDKRIKWGTDDLKAKEDNFFLERKGAHEIPVR